MVDFDGFSCRKIYIQSSHGWHGFSQEAVSNHPCETPWNESTFGGPNLAFPRGEKLCHLWPVGPWGKLAMQFPTILIFERTKPALLAKEKHCCLIGILHIGVWNHPHITRWYNPVYTLNNQGFIHCSFRQLYCNIILWDGITACYSASGESLKTLFVWNKTMAKVAETVFKTNRPISGVSY